MSNMDFFRPQEPAPTAPIEDLLDKGVAMPHFEQPEVEPMPANIFGGRTMKVAKTGKPARIVDHSWTEDIDDPPFCGRDIALNNKPEFARFRQFSDNVYEENKLMSDAEEAEYHDHANVKVLNAITDILNESLDDKKKSRKISGLLGELASRGYDFRKNATVEFLKNQVGPAGELYVIAGKSERECREHAKKIRIRATAGLRPKFVCARWDGQNPDLHILERIYQMPVRDKIRLAVKDFEEELVTPLMKTADGADLVNSILCSTKSVARAYRRIKRATITMGVMSRIKKQAAGDQVTHSIPTNRQPLPAPRTARKERVSAELYNQIFTALGKRDYRALRSLSRSSHPVTAKAGGNAAYRRALYAVLSGSDGMRLYGSDLGAQNPARPSLNEVARFFGVPRHEHTRLSSALKNVKFEREGKILTSNGVFSNHDAFDEGLENRETQAAESLFGSLGRTVSLGGETFAEGEETRPLPFSRSRQAGLPTEVLEEEAASEFDESEDKGKDDDFSIKSDHSVAGPTARTTMKADPKADVGQPSDQLPLSNFDFADPRGLFPG